MTNDTALALVAVLDRRDVDPDVAAHICRAAIDAQVATGHEGEVGTTVALATLREASIGYLDESDPFVRREIRAEALKSSNLE